MPDLRGLYAITPERPDMADLLRDVEAAFVGGCRLLQYRDKISDAAERRCRGEALRTLSSRYEARLVVNDDVALASLLNADGVHLGRDDGDIRAARAVLGYDSLIGASCYADFQLAKAAAQAGADYLAFGAVFPSPTKPESGRASLELLSRCRDELTLPACAIGGITLANAPQAIVAGASLVAVITDLFSADSISAQAAAYQLLFKEHRS